MLIYAVGITRGESARAELGDELNDKRRAMAKYPRKSLLLLVPLLVPIVALSQERRRAQFKRPLRSSAASHDLSQCFDGRMEQRNFAIYLPTYRSARRSHTQS